MHDVPNATTRNATNSPSPSSLTGADANCIHPAQTYSGRFVHQGLRQFRARGESLVVKWEDVARKAPLRFAFVTAAALMVMVFASLAPSFHSNDDPQMAMIAAGKGTCQAPDEHLVFTNVVIGHVLKSLYMACPSIPWYGAYLYLAQYLAQVAILYCTIAPGYTRLRMGLYLLFFVTVGMFLLNNLQFTTTASLAGQSGALLCLLALRSQGAVPGFRASKLLASGVALLLLGSLIRLECFYMISLIALPPAICVIGWAPPRRVLLSAAGTVGVCLALVTGFAAYNDAYYERDPQWRHFFSYNKCRIKFNDYGWTNYTPQTSHVFEQVNWSENDHAMIANWFYEDPVVYSEARLRHVLESYPWRVRRLTSEYWRNCARTILSDKSLWSAALMLPLFLWCTARSRQNVLAFLASVAVAATLFGGMAVLYKLPPGHVYYSVLTFPLALLLLMARGHVDLPHQRWPALTLRFVVSLSYGRHSPVRLLFRPKVVHVLVIFTVMGLVYGMGRQYRLSHRMQTARRDLLQSFAALQSRDDQLYVFWAPGFPYEAISPFDNLTSFSNLHQLVLGWPQRTPTSEAMKRNFGIADISRALYERPDVFLVGDPNCHALVQKYIQEHHGVDVDFVVKYAGRHSYDVVGQFEPSAGNEATSTADRSTPLPR